MTAPAPKIRLVTAGHDPIPDFPEHLRPDAIATLDVAKQFAADPNVLEVVQVFSDTMCGARLDMAQIRRLVGHAVYLEQNNDEPIHVEPRRFRLHTVDELLSRPYSTWTVRDVIPASGLVVVYGGPGSGKTFLMLDMTMAIARGIKWHGRRTKQGIAVYVAGEGALRGRVTAYLRQNELDDVPGFFALESAVNLLDQNADVPDLIDCIRAKVGDQPVRMIVIDTLARAMPGGNENASEDMGAVIGSAGKLSAAFSCVLAFVHHSGKDDTKGSRGHSSLKGACDAEISVKRDGDAREATAEKVRDGPDAMSLLTFRLQPIDLGAVSEFDPDAEEWERITSCVVSTSDVPARPRREPSTKNQQSALAAIRATLAAEGKRALTQEEALRCIRAGTDMARNRAHEAIEGLIKNCYLKHSPMGGIEVLNDE